MDLDLDELKRLHEAATPGAWIAEYSASTGNCVIPADAESTLEAVCMTRLYHAAFDAQLIAAMRNALPALIAAAEEREELRLDLEAAREVARYDLNRADRLAKAVAAVRELHSPDGFPEPLCKTCGSPWPCPTTAALGQT